MSRPDPNPTDPSSVLPEYEHYKKFFPSVQNAEYEVFGNKEKLEPFLKEGFFASQLKLLIKSSIHKFKTSRGPSGWTASRSLDEYYINTMNSIYRSYSGKNEARLQIENYRNQHLKDAYKIVHEIMVSNCKSTEWMENDCAKQIEKYRANASDAYWEIGKEAAIFLLGAGLGKAAKNIWKGASNAPQMIRATKKIVKRKRKRVVDVAIPIMAPNFTNHYQDEFIRSTLEIGTSGVSNAVGHRIINSGKDFKVFNTMEAFMQDEDEDIIALADVVQGFIPVVSQAVTLDTIIGNYNLGRSESRNAESVILNHFSKIITELQPKFNRLVNSDISSLKNYPNYVQDLFNTFGISESELRLSYKPYND